ncbi:colanic acid biosynthesis glycosyltransferase WcaI [Rhodoblastus sphagnicola]|uniref:Colanic acid biosynthesis glycosyltransferase WcaI n=1 Tax=Rhodoblastus sphagnicola TaxID=333368 RepID=A0A2S6NAR5_9HYPH|nr:WcaI family glycosyltransferase [Rhodoblastus sphagnicola]MBB4201211.1 colanic acid biosynthesis glycosyl transferase WcaI [Rhodoblastus sphagnicola]PPQ31710.1 colanic acid biosynthesis glycosyltransferase WcaI [Rhodoblastus sphagnicola]
MLDFRVAAADKAPSAGVAKTSKILIHVANFYPEFIGVGKYAGEFAFALAESGNSVEVVTAPPHYPGWRVGDGYRFLSYSREEIRGVNVRRCPIICKPNGGGLWRILAPLTFAAFAAPVVFYRILASRPDVVLCVEPTLFSVPAALLAAKLVGARTVLHVQDLEVDAAFEVHLKGERTRKFAEAIERFILRGFDLTVTISRKMRQALLRKGVESDRCAVIRNWVDLGAIFPLAPDAPNAFRQELGIAPETFVVLYSGNIGRKQALNVVADAARLCRDDAKIHFIIAGDGPAKADIVQSCSDLSNVSFLPLQPLERFNELLNAANAHVLPQLKNTADLVLPSKLGGMLASGRPVIATVEKDTELEQMLRGSAFLTQPEDPQLLAKTIREVAMADLSEIKRRSLQLAKFLDARTVLPAFEDAILDHENDSALGSHNGDAIFEFSST